MTARLATAQPVELSALELCASQETPDLKLACFEAIIADRKAPEAEASDAAKTAETAPASVQAETAPKAEASETVAPAAETVATPPAVQVESIPHAGESEPVTPVAESVSAAPAQAGSAEPAAIAAVSSSADDEFGQEYLEKTEQQKVENDEDLRATVVDVSKGRHDILYFHLDNGQVWRQNEPRHYSYPKNSDFDVTISRGMMGDYRMRIGDNGRMVRIRRIK